LVLLLEIDRVQTVYEQCVGDFTEEQSRSRYLDAIGV
jgi:hypothetical protein